MTEADRQTRPDAVPTRLSSPGEIRARWAWVEAEMWTKSMLTALANGVRGGNAFFADLGLFSLVTAYASARQSPQG